MTRLSSAIVSHFSDAVLKQLEKDKAITAYGFLKKPSEYLAAVTGLGYSKIERIKQSVTAKYASSVETAFSIYSDMLFKAAIVSSGITSLDELIGGGFETGHIYEFCGTCGCGKSQICMCAAAAAARSGHGALYIDTKGDFYAERVAAFLGTDATHCLERIHVATVRSGEELLNILFDCDEIMQKVRLIIVDSVPALFPYLGLAKLDRNNALISAVASRLHYLANEYSVAVLVTNFLSSYGDETSTASLGKQWMHEMDTRILLSRIDGVKIRVTVEKSSFHQVGGSSTIELEASCIT